MKIPTIDRRTFIGGVVGACVVPVLGPLTASAEEQTLPRYCALEQNVDLGKLQARRTTGNKRLDSALIAELRNVIDVLRVNPGFRIIDDSGQPNAYAWDKTIQRNTQGTVLFGRTLISDEIFRSNGGYALAGVTAHECAHIFQYFSSYGPLITKGQKTMRTMELHADFLAGYYLGCRKRDDARLDAFESSLRKRGDWAYNDQQHHGTPDERAASMHHGYDLGKKKNVSLGTAAKQGAEYVLQ